MSRALTRPSLFNIVSLVFGLAFLYLPIAILVIYSFNASRLVTVWGGWSTRWYVELLSDRAMLEATWMSLRVGVASATLATVLGTMAAGWMLAFTLSLDDLVIASFTTGPGASTLPIRIYSEVRLGVKPEINAICTVVIALVALLIVAASLAAKLSSQRAESAAPL